MTTQMTDDEFKGQMKRFGFIGVSPLCHVLYLKTGVILRPQTVSTHLERYGHLSCVMTAAFRLLFRELERQHEQA